MQIKEAAAEGEVEVVVVTVGDGGCRGGVVGVPGEGRRSRDSDLGRGTGRPRAAADRVGPRASDRQGGTGSGPLRRPVVRRGFERHRGRARRDARSPARRRGSTPGAQAGGRNRLGRSGAGGRAHRGALGSHPGAADDPDRNQRAALREPPGDQAGRLEAARTRRPRGARAWTIDAIASARGARTVALLPPPKRGGGATMLEGDVAAVADRIVAIMDESVPDRHGAGA